MNAPAQPPSGMSSKSGTVVPGFTRTCAPLPKRAGARGFFSFLLLPLTAIPPLSFSAVVVERSSSRTSPRIFFRRQARTARPTASGYNDSMKILFLHGWQSVPGGVKPTFLAQHGHEVVNPKLPDDDFAEAVRIAQAEFDKHQPAVVVGSSRDGAVAMNINSGDAPLLLLCPAWKKHGSARTVKPGTVILHSRADDVVPFADSEALLRDSGLPASALIEVGDDHWLADPEPLAAMVEAWENLRR